ncbi:MAG: cytochrome d ubiquinol oxidase subunit II [Bacteroidales bacterium]|nr:cytochrome d ubiquinol oxidase subunit II [Bacteroidales bacterium]
MDALYFLQHYWWALVSLLGALLVFLLFVQGLQGLIFNVASSQQEKDHVVKYAGHKWEITFTTLVTFGGAAFASFPLFYSTSFGGAYWLWIAILFCFVIQAVSFEFRNDAGNILGAKTYETFLFINGALGTFLLGVAVATLFSGGAFTVNKGAITDVSAPVISQWTNGWHGLDALANPFNLLLGVVVFAAARTLGLLYLCTKEDIGDFKEKCQKRVYITSIIFVVTFVAFVLWLMLRSGLSVDPATGIISEEPYKYLHNMIQVWPLAAIFLIGVVLVLLGLGRHFLGKGLSKNFYIVGGGTVLAVFALLLCAGFNNTSFFPSTIDIQDSLTLYNASSSLFTLKVMAIVSIAIPFVIAYIVWAWRKLR